MERKIGETFEYEGKTFRVKEDENYGCHGCFFYKRCTLSVIKMVGQCDPDCRTDGKSVIFVEVQEHQTGEHEAVKERKVGEVFEFEGHKLKVVADTDGRKCPKCFFYSRDCSLIRDVTGFCLKEKRIDRKGVTFVEVNDEQPHVQAEQPQLNLCEILKHCPQGETFWSPMLDGVKFSCIDEERQMIIVETIEGHFTWEINADGTISIDEVTSPEVMLYPSKEMRDWSKFTAPWLKKERFDPQTLNPFDKVLVRFDCGVWSATLFSHLIDSKFANKKYDIICCGTVFGYCIPYNDDTKHLVGTKDEAPVFYRYWED